MRMLHHIKQAQHRIRPLSFSFIRCLSSRAPENTALHFYQNRQLELYASKEAKRLTLRQLVYFGRSMTDERLIKSANYVRTELPVRIAHRLRDLQALPYIVVTQEGVARVYELYWSAFEKFRRYPPITTIEENDKFCDFVAELLNEHAPVIPNLSLGLSLSSPYLSPDKLDSFMRRMLVSRISRRVLAEHHIALSKGFTGHGKKSQTEPHVGVIFTGLSIRRSVERCVDILHNNKTLATDFLGSSNSKPPAIHIEGHLETQFAYIREHLDYIIFELLKNSMRAVHLNHRNQDTVPPIQVTIVAGDHDVGIRISDQGGGLRNAQNEAMSPSDLFSFSHVRNAERLGDERIDALRNASSSDKGLRATIDEQINDEKSGNHEALCRKSIGIGLPMSHIYATYFGGSLDLVSLDGWGTDAYVRLPKLGTNLEGIEV